MEERNGNGNGGGKDFKKRVCKFSANWRSRNGPVGRTWHKAAQGMYLLGWAFGSGSWASKAFGFNMSSSRAWSLNGSRVYKMGRKGRGVGIFLLFLFLLGANKGPEKGVAINANRGKEEKKTWQ